MSPWKDGVVPQGSISGREWSQAWRDTAAHRAALVRRTRLWHVLELLAAGLAGAIVAVLFVALEGVLRNG